MVSLQGSNIWFRSIVDQSNVSANAQQSAVVSPGRAATSSSQSAMGDGQTNDSPNKERKEVNEPSQSYWHDAIAEYDTTSQASGPEVLSSISSAAKIFWHRSLKQEILKKKLEEAAIPSNCDFLLPKKVNTEIWSKMGSFNRTNDFKLQEAQLTHSAATTMMLRAASSLTEMFKDNMPKQVKDALTDLKDSMTLAGKVSQQINQSRRDMIKPTFSKEYKKLAAEADETSELLFGTELCAKMEKLKKESNLCNMLSQKDSNSGKRKYFNETKNTVPSPKTQRKVVYGQRSQDRANNMKENYNKEKKASQKGHQQRPYKHYNKKN